MSSPQESTSPPHLGAERNLAPCHSRREYDSPAGIYFCAHPQVFAAGDLVTFGICAQCRRWQEPPPDRYRSHPSGTGRSLGIPCFHLGEQTGLRECPSCQGNVRLKVFACHHPAHQETTLDECRFCSEYDPPLRAAGVRRWAVGVTTAPRRTPTLARCLQSLQVAGWNEVRLFAEPESILPQPSSDLCVTWRESILGAWPNYYLGLAELYFRNPEADAYFMLEDDVIFCKNLRPYLEKTLWPQSKAAYFSLYEPLGLGGTVAGFQALPDLEQLPGALAVIFPNASARMLLADAQVVNYRRTSLGGGCAETDWVVSRWAKRTQLPEMIHIPSLAQHVGDTTTIGPVAQDSFVRQSNSFVGETFDAGQLLNSDGNSPAESN